MEKRQTETESRKVTEAETGEIETFTKNILNFCHVKRLQE